MKLTKKAGLDSRNEELTLSGEVVRHGLETRMSNTLNELIDLNVNLTVVCNECHYSVEIDPMQWAGERGGDTRLDELKPRLVCTRCKSRKCGFQLRPKHMPDFPQTPKQE